MRERLSDTKEFFLDILYLFGVFLSSGYSIPPRYACDRESYNRFMEEHEKIKARKLVYELKRQKFLKIKKKEDEVIFELTQKGRLEVLKEKVLSTADNLPNNQVCLVSFDIPENVKKTRFALRRFLIQIGFKQVHLSVMETSLDVVEPLKQLVDILDIARWVKVYRAELAQ